MKAEDLMIGDWVRVTDDDTDAFFDARVGTLTRVENIYLVPPGEEMAQTFSIDCVEPIPITPEILEKNGFVMDKEEKTHGITYHILIPTGYEANSYTIQITLYKEPICGVSVLLKIWGWIPPYDGGINDIHLCGAKYVHELQHALKLCGIDKTIEL